VISNETLQKLAAQVGATLDESAMNGLRDIADDFVESVTVFAAEIAKHANSDTIRAKDVQLHFEQNWGLSLAPPSKKAKTDTNTTEEESVSAPIGSGSVIAVTTTTSVAPPTSLEPVAPAAPSQQVGTAQQQHISVVVPPPVPAAPIRLTNHMQRVSLKQRMLAANQPMQHKI
jgi:histone H3/H4